MKTTNKILVITLTLFILAIVAILVYIRTEISHDMIRVEGSGNVQTEQREVAPFNKISVSGNLVLHLKQDESQQVEVQADDNLLELVMTEVQDGRLSLYLDGPVGRHEKLEVFVSVTELEELSVSRGAQAHAETTVTSEYLAHTLQAGAKSTLNLQVGTLDLRAQAGAVSRLTGKADIMNISSTAGAIIYAGELLVEICDIEASAGSLNYLHVTGSLSGRARYGALVHVEGDPDMEHYHSRHDVEYEVTEDGYSATYN